MLAESMNGQPIIPAKRLLGELRTLANQACLVESYATEARTQATMRVEGLRRSAEEKSATWQAQLKEKEAALEAARRLAREMEKSQGAKIHDLETELAQKQRLIDTRGREVDDLKIEIVALIGRIANVEAAAETARAEASRRFEQVQESGRAVATALQAQLWGKSQALEAKQIEINELEQHLNTRIADLSQQLASRQALLEIRERDTQNLKSEIDDLTQQVAAMESAVAQILAEAAVQLVQVQERAQTAADKAQAQLRDKDDALQAQQCALAEKQVLLERRAEEIENLKSEIERITGRAIESEAAFMKAQAQAADRAEKMRQSADAEMAALRSQLQEKEQKSQATQAAVHELEQSRNERIAELERQVGDTEALLKSREEEINYLRAEFDKLLERLTQTESTSKRFEVESAVHAELRDRARSEAEALRAQLGEREETVRKTLSTARAAEDGSKVAIQGFRGQLAEQNERLKRRDREVNELKSKINALLEGIAESEASVKKAQAAAARQLENVRDSANTEVSTLQAQLLEKETALEEKQSAIQELEQNLNATLADLQSRLTQKERLLEGRDAEIDELKANLDTLHSRVAGMESTRREEKAEATARVEQIREAVRQEVEELRARLQEQTQALQIKHVESDEVERKLNTVVGQLQAELAERQAEAEGRQREIEKLQSKMGSVAEWVAELESALRDAQPAAVAEAEQNQDGDRVRAPARQTLIEILAVEESAGDRVIEPKETVTSSTSDAVVEVMEIPESLESQNGASNEAVGLADSLFGMNLPAVMPNGDAAYFSLTNPPLTFQHATETFPLKFMEEYKFFPMRLHDGSFAVVMSDPSDVYTLDGIRLQARTAVRVYRGDEQEILTAIQQHCGPSSSMERIVQDIAEEGESVAEDDDVAHLKDLASEAPVIRLVNLLIAKAVEDRASDIHVEPFEGSLRVRYRIDGVLVNAEAPPQRLQAAIVSRIKLMARMNIAERRLPQDGRIRMELDGRDIDLRVSTFPTLHGESVVLRILDRSNVLLSLDELGYPPDIRRQFEGLIRKPNGIILVTGPTGSGKTTTLYAALQTINSIDKNIITIEDPVEYQLKGVKQIQVRPKIGLTFSSGLRHIVRQDPDIILVGEIRDRETAEIAIHAALTGHLVLSTLHTNNAAGAITRLVDMGIESYLVSSTLLAVLAQRLVRKICPKCKTAGSPDERSLQNINIPAAEAKALSLYHGEGCPECNFTGYFSRLGIVELLSVDAGVQRLIVDKADSRSIQEKAVQSGMKTLWQDGWEKTLAGITTLDELLRVTCET